jgi:hypothetical protein
LVLPIIAYILSSTKLEIRAEQSFFIFLPGNEGLGWVREGAEGRGEK